MVHLLISTLKRTSLSTPWESRRKLTVRFVIPCFDSSILATPISEHPFVMVDQIMGVLDEFQLGAGRDRPLAYNPKSSSKGRTPFYQEISFPSLRSFQSLYLLFETFLTSNIYPFAPTSCSQFSTSYNLRPKCSAFPQISRKLLPQRPSFPPPTKNNINNPTSRSIHSFNRHEPCEDPQPANCDGFFSATFTSSIMTWTACDKRRNGSLPKQNETRSRGLLFVATS